MAPSCAFSDSAPRYAPSGYRVSQVRVRNTYTVQDLLCVRSADRVLRRRRRNPLATLTFFGLDGELGAFPAAPAQITRENAMCNAMTGPGRVPFDVWG